MNKCNMDMSDFLKNHPDVKLVDLSVDNCQHKLKGKINNPNGRPKKKYPTRQLKRRVDARFFDELSKLIDKAHKNLIAASDAQKSKAGKKNVRNTGSSPNDPPAV